MISITQYDQKEIFATLSALCSSVGCSLVTVVLRFFMDFLEIEKTYSLSRFDLQKDTCLYTNKELLLICVYSHIQILSNFLYLSVFGGRSSEVIFWIFLRTVLRIIFHKIYLVKMFQLHSRKEKGL